jgi:hypothetical protein
MEKLTKWVGACMVLHNFLLADATPDIDHDLIDVTASLDNNDLPVEGSTVLGTNSKRRFTRRYYNTSNYLNYVVSFLSLQRSYSLILLTFLKKVHFPYCFVQ